MGRDWGLLVNDLHGIFSGFLLVFFLHNYLLGSECLLMNIQCLFLLLIIMQIKGPYMHIHNIIVFH